MNILFLTLLDFNNTKTRGIYTDLLREFIKNGHRLIIVSPSEKRKKQKTRFLEYPNYKLLKPSIGNIQKTNIFEKGLSTVLLTRKFIQAIKYYLPNEKIDLILYSTPPITLYRVVKYIKKRNDAKTYLLLKDIFPQNAIDIGMLKKTSVLYWWFRRIEKNLYRISDYIGCMSQANVDYVLRHNKDIPSESFEVCPNSLEPLDYTYFKVDKNDIRKRYNIPYDKAIFLYGGNLGKPQGIDFLIECLKIVDNQNKAFFVIVGSGTEFQRLQKIFETQKIKNAILYSNLPQKEYDELVVSCDVGLILLDHRFTIPNIPSRLLSYLQASIPVLAATDSSTDIKDIIMNGNFGLWCESNDTEKFFNSVFILCNEHFRKILGVNGRYYFEKNFDVKQSYEVIIKHFIEQKGEKYV